VTPNTNVNVSGGGFTPGELVDVFLSTPGSKKASQVALATATKDGNISASFPFPSSVTANDASRTVTAQQRNTRKTATADIVVSQGVGQITLSATTGSPGATVKISATGYAPHEEVDVYWGRPSGTPTDKLQADEHGSVDKIAVTVNVPAVGNSTVFVVGAKSGTTSSSSFMVLSLYPNVSVANYSLKGAQRLSISGKNYFPGELVDVYVNTASGVPVAKIPTDATGAFKDFGIVLPYKLIGTQQLVLVGEKSRASAGSGFTIQKFTPTVRTSTYGGLPGTAITFFGTGFAPSEVVKVFGSKAKGSPSALVSACRADAQGKISACGSYVIPSSAGDNVAFTLTGMLSDGTASIGFKVDHSLQVSVPDAPPYVLPPELSK
jgi:hypothetical protein